MKIGKSWGGGGGGGGGGKAIFRGFVMCTLNLMYFAASFQVEIVWGGGGGGMPPKNPDVIICTCPQMTEPLVRP